MIDPELLKAYSNTDFVVFEQNNEKEIVICVGKSNEALDSFFGKNNVKQAVYLTAYNPCSKIMTEDENQSRHQQLLSEVDALGYKYYEGEGRDPTGQWSPERSLLILEIPTEQAERLALNYEQNAYVSVRQFEPPQLVITARL